MAAMVKANLYYKSGHVYEENYDVPLGVWSIERPDRSYTGLSGDSGVIRFELRGSKEGVLQYHEEDT